MRIFNPDAENSGYNPYEFVSVDDKPELDSITILDRIANVFNFICCFTGGIVIGWNLCRLLKYLAGDVNVSFSPW